MNFIFWALLVLMLLIAIGIIIYPLLRNRGSTSVAYRESNMGLYEEKLHELDTDLAEARIDEDNYRTARQELDRELLDNVPVENSATAAEHYTTKAKRHPALALVLAIFLPAFALLLYQDLGMHASTEVAQMTGAQQATPSVEEMTAKLETYLQSNAGTVQEWRMLGRAYKHLKRYPDSVKAFSHALELQPDAQLMLEKAEAIALQNNEVFNDEARALVLQAKKLEPDNINVLWFAGVAEFQAEHYHETIENLSRLASVAKTDKDVDQSIRFYLEKARAALVAQGDNIASVDELLQVPESPAVQTNTAAAAAGASIRIAVNVNAEVRAKFSSTDTVFIYAKAAQGPKMPLAVQRLTLAQLPAEVKLDDSMSMIDGMNLSAFPSVVVAARISRSGSAIAQSGDYIGEVKVDDVNSADKVIVISIDRVVP